MLTVDYGVPREFGVLALRWRSGAAASRYAIDLSDDGEHWRDVRRVDRARGDLQSHWLPDSEARFVRISVDEPAAKVVALAELELRAPVEANAFFAGLAKEAPRGRYPRAYLGQQTYWTVLGVDGGRTASLLSEDGVLEPVPGVGALEPFLIVDGNVLSWADVRSSHTLQDGDLPMPSVHWRAGDLALDISAFGDGTPDAAQALARYRVRNLGKDVRRVTLALAWRPFQANPPTQFLAHPGGASAIDALDWDGRVLTVNGAPRLRALVAPSAVRLEPLAAGPVGDWLREPRPSPAPVHLADPAGFASAALLFDLTLDAGEEREVAVALPVDGAPMASARGRHRRGRGACGRALARPPGPRAHLGAGRGRRGRAHIAHFAGPHPRQPQRRPRCSRERAPMPARGSATAPSPRRRCCASARTTSRASSSSGSRRSSSRAARCRAARPPAAPTRCPRTTVTANSPSRPPTSGSTPATKRRRVPCGRTCAARSSTWTRCAGASGRQRTWHPIAAPTSA